jgi:hypothetical protein
MLPGQVGEARRQLPQHLADCFSSKPGRLDRGCTVALDGEQDV